MDLECQVVEILEGQTKEFRFYSASNREPVLEDLLTISFYIKVARCGVALS